MVTLLARARTKHGPTRVISDGRHTPEKNVEERNPHSTLSVKMEPIILEELKADARLLSVERQDDVTVSSIVRGLVNEYLGRRRVAAQ
jgi:hypothetical protein